MDNVSKAEGMVVLFFTVANYSVWVGSLGLMCLGAWMLVESTRFDTLFAEDDIIPIAVIILGFGFLLFVNGFFGCCGTLKRRNPCLLIYVIIMLLIILGELILIILYLLQTEEMELGSSTTEASGNDSKESIVVTDSMHNIHEEECVGDSLQELNSIIFLGVFVGILPFEVCAIIFSCLLICANKNRNECL